MYVTSNNKNGVYSAQWFKKLDKICKARIFKIKFLLLANLPLKCKKRYSMCARSQWHQNFAYGYQKTQNLRGFIARQKRKFMKECLYIISFSEFFTIFYRCPVHLYFCTVASLKTSVHTQVVTWRYGSKNPDTRTSAVGSREQSSRSQPSSSPASNITLNQGVRKRRRLYLGYLGPLGSASESVSHNYQVWIRLRILPSSSTNSKKNLDFYCFVTSYDFLSLKNDVNVPVFRIRIWIRTKMSRIRKTGHRIVSVKSLESEHQNPHKTAIPWNQCCGSRSGSVGFWASWIRIQ